MNVTETSAEGLKREFKITVPANEVEDQITRRLGEIGQSVRIPGFRPGKVPMPMLRRRYGPAVRGEVLESAVQDSSAEAMREHNLRPALPPRVEIVSASEGTDLEYNMSLEVLPDMPEPDFASLELERLIAEVPEEDVDRAVERIAEGQRKSEPVERPAESGDIIVADVVGHVGADEIPGSRGEGRQIELGAEGLLPGFSEQLLGAAVGETRAVRVTFPEDYGNPDFAGKEGVFEVAVKEVRQRLPAALDDTLAEAVGLTTLAELRQEIRQRMQRDYDGVARQHLKRALLDKLFERYEFPVPTGMVEVEFQSIWQQYEAEKQQREQLAAEQATAAAAAAPAPAVAAVEGPLDAAAMIAPEETALEGASDRSPAGAEADRPQPHETAREPAAHEVPAARGSAAAAEEPLDAAAIIAPEETALEGASDSEPAAAADPDEEKARAEFRRVAERRVRLGLLLAEVGRNANITVSQEELNQALTQEARRHPGYERQVIDYYRKNPEALNNLRAPIYEEKVVDFIVELAKPGERRVTPRELIASGAPDGDGADPDPDPAEDATTAS
ncbi:MAG TPA: trigger factor [Stellaceae bacterium]|nr:trigger factor [Stellaceae bacterium]